MQYNPPLTMVASKLLLLVLVLSNTILPAISCFTAMFSFGDSITDTGNEAILADTCWGIRYPYGETYFGRPTGRCSNGRLVVDFIAEALGLPFLPPYQARLTGQQNFRQGVNFAVGGATALSRDFLVKKGIVINWTNYPLGTQVQWFKELLPSLCSSKSECDDLLGNSLFLVGEFGGNDYGRLFFQNKTPADVIQNYVPSVIDAISSAINVLIGLGAKTLVVPGNFPIGCIPKFIGFFQSNKTDYDTETGCLIWLNEFTEFHNRELKHELDKLRRRHTETIIIYADYYEASMRMYRFPGKFGFNKNVLDACCGVRGPYNFNLSMVCGEEGFDYLCDDPSRYISWDGNHQTEAAFKIVSDGLMKGPFADPPIFSLCSEKATHLLSRVVNPVVQY